ncbi:uncharacterized protein BKA78DRAFT_318372 [Phyllosticta capitalensis]|uniref:uncharacterized protein n=1 Tax=Phyllosticta capitalensis TaxID=121624 RepID=UPI00312E6F81
MQFSKACLPPLELLRCLFVWLQMASSICVVLDTSDESRARNSRLLLSITLARQLRPFFHFRQNFLQASMPLALKTCVSSISAAYLCLPLKSCSRSPFIQRFHLGLAHPSAAGSERTTRCGEGTLARINSWGARRLSISSTLGPGKYLQCAAAHVDQRKLAAGW